MQNNQAGPYLTPYANIDENGSWLSIRAKIVKLLEENIQPNLHDLGSDNGILGMTPKAKVTKEKLHLIKI